LDVRLEDLKVTLNDMLQDYQEAVKEGKVICLSYHLDICLSYLRYGICICEMTLNDMLDDFHEAVKEGKVICLSCVRSDLILCGICLIQP